VAGACLALSSACAGPVHGLYPPAEGEAVRAVYVISHGWHTGIAVRTDDIPSDLWPEHRDFAGAEYVEVGWGNRAFYMAPRGTLWLALRAVFWPTESVLHVVGFRGPVDRAFPLAEIVEIRVSDRGLRELAAFVQDAYARNPAGEPIRIGPGQYPGSHFYLAREKYFLMKTCNTWTASALRSTGAPVTPIFAVTAGGLMEQARKIGRRVSGRAAARDRGASCPAERGASCSRSA
jgi:uncharacterized protein (TIGR02117 family)